MVGGTGTSTTAQDRATGDPGTGGDARGTRARGLEGPPPEAPVSAELQAFVKLLEDGPATVAAAPATLRLPAPLARSVFERLDATQDDGVEHGLLFGYGGPRFTFVAAHADGTESAIDYARARNQWPWVRFVGVFHAHPYAIGAGEGATATGRSGGGHSGTDLAQHFRRSERASMVGAYDQGGRRWLYLLLKPRDFTIPGPPQKVGDAYQARVVARLDRGAEPHDASLAELTSLAHGGAFALYVAADTPVLGKV